ncbi:hypothetical protein HS088_TW12G00295 [Tripterygium wilfordii]|uniref:Uncharacterized protein n=2 Tax=Tripterygium wilfordii TaxID=458696 RepID=A0A7J7CZ46_TRIWF|nr:hypothetical protein HS088_TW12G00295 [Tripterygium wilfordii]
MAMLSPPVAHFATLKYSSSSSGPSPLPCLQNHRPPPYLRSNRYACLVLCSAASLPPPGPNRPPQKDPSRLTGFTSSFSRFQDHVRIFFAVLFWLSLFFWSSAWDGRNNSRRDKGSRPRR